MLDEPSGKRLHHGFLARGYSELAHREISVERSVPAPGGTKPALLALQEVGEDVCVGIDLKYVPSACGSLIKAGGVSWHPTFGGLDATCAVSPKKSPRGNVPLGDESRLATRLECRTRGVVQERRAPRRDRSKFAADDYGAGRRRQGALVG